MLRQGNADLPSAWLKIIKKRRFRRHFLPLLAQMCVTFRCLWSRKWVTYLFRSSPLIRSPPSQALMHWLTHILAQYAYLDYK